MLIVSALLEGHGISDNGYGNTSTPPPSSRCCCLHNFFFVSADPGGLMSVDKPPLALWLQAVSAKVLGFHALVILLPEAACGFLAVLCTYYIVAPRFGRWTAVGAAGAVAVCPGFVATTRDNNPDALLILLMLLAGWALVRAIETDRLRTLILAAVLAGLAFNTKALAGYLVVPGMGLAYLVCANGSWRRRALRTAGGALVLGVVSLVWIVAVDLVPQSQRPWVGGTTDELGDLADLRLQRLRGVSRARSAVRGRASRRASSGPRRPNPAPNSKSDRRRADQGARARGDRLEAAAVRVLAS